MKKSLFHIAFIFTFYFALFSIVKGYEYGDIVSYNNVKFYVLEDNGEVVTLLTKDYLTTIDINYFGRWHVNWYNSYKEGYPSKIYTKEAVDTYGYGKVAFYSSKTCNTIDNTYINCTNNYDKSDIKYIVDAWAKKNLIPSILFQIRLDIVFD